MRLAVFASGSGTNFQAMLDAIDAGDLPAEVVCCVSNTPDAGALDRADRHDVPTAVIEPSSFDAPAPFGRALLETLALIAYRQPITRGEIEDIRGVTVSSNIIRTLAEREWVRVVGHRDVPGRPAMYATTRSFLDYFNLRGLDELPTLSEIRDLEEIGREMEKNMQGEIEFDTSDQTLH